MSGAAERLAFHELRHIIQCILLAVAFCASAAPALPQSFDCKEASRPMEHAICNDKAVADMDVRLSAKYREALASHVKNRRELISSERRWLSRRDAQCFPYLNDFAKLDDCLRPAYGARLRAIASWDSLSDIRGIPPPASDVCVLSGNTSGTARNAGITDLQFKCAPEAVVMGLEDPDLAAVPKGVWLRGSGCVKKLFDDGHLAGWIDGSG